MYIWGLNSCFSFLFFFFSLWFTVWKSTSRPYPSIHTEVCVRKSCSEKGKKKMAETLKVRKWNLDVSESVRLGSRCVIFLWICFLWDWCGRWCFWESRHMEARERMCMWVDWVSKWVWAGAERCSRSHKWFWFHYQLPKAVSGARTPWDSFLEFTVILGGSQKSQTFW